MKPKNLCNILVVLVMCAVVGLGGMTAASKAGQESKEKQVSTQRKASVHDHEAMMEKWKEFATPNENHKVLGALVGEWDYTAKWRMSPDAEPEVSTGTSEIEWIMGGRFIQHEIEGTHMEQPFEGMGITGYDNQKKQYQSVWLDNMGTGIMTGSGSYDSATKSFTDQGTFSCPGEGEKSYRGVTKIVDKDNFTYEWYMTGPDGKEFRAGEIIYTRNK